MRRQVLFYFFAAVSVISALLAVSRKNPVISVVWLVVCMCSLAVIFVLLNAFFLAAVAIMPFIARGITDVTVLTISSTALLIAVGVALDTMRQLEAQLTMRRYEGFLK